MKNMAKRLLAAFLCLALLASVPISLAVSAADTPEQSAARQALIEAWNALEKEECHEIGSLSGNKVAEAPETAFAGLTDEEVALLGTYYALKETTGDVTGGLTHSGMSNLTGYEKITWSIYNAGTVTSAVSLSVSNASNWLASWYNVAGGEIKTYTFEATNANAAKLFNGELTASKPYAKVENGASTVYFGSPFAWKTVKLSAPEGAADMSLAALVTEAEKLDVTGFVGETAFKEALAALKALITPEAIAASELVEAWNALSKREGTTLAYAGAATDIANLPDTLDLTAEQKALLGDKYLNGVTGQKQSYSAPGKGKDLSIYDSLSVSAYVASGSSQITIGYESGGNWVWLWNWRTCQTGFFTQEVTKEEATGAWVSLLDGTKKINGYASEIHSGTVADVYVGSLMGWKTTKLSAPENAAELSLTELVAAAKEVDATGYTGAEDFAAALAVAEELVSPEDMAANDLIREWNNLSKVVTETVAVPKNHPTTANYTAVSIKEVTDTTVVNGLTDLSVLGTHYVEPSAIETAESNPYEFFFTRVAESDVTYESIYVYAIGYADAEATTTVTMKLDLENNGHNWVSRNGWGQFSFLGNKTVVTQPKITVMMGDGASAKAAAVAYGSMIGVRTVKLSAPEKAAEMSLAELVAEAEKVDLAGFEADAFKTALAAAKTFVSPEKIAITNLIKAWNSLSKEVPYEIGYLAGGDFDTLQRTETVVSTSLAGLTEDEIAAFGTYYAAMTGTGQLGGGNPHADMKDLSGYEKITWTVYNSGTTGSAIDLSLDSYNSWLFTWHTVQAGEVKTFTFDTTNTQAAALLGGTKEVAKPFAKVESGSGTVYFGTPMAWKTVTLSAPENAEEMSLEAIVAAAKEVDATGYTGAEDFAAALTTADGYIVTPREALLDAWSKLTQEKPYEIGYLAGGDFSVLQRTESVVNTTLADLTEEEIAAFGTYYASMTGVGQLGGGNPNADMKDLSGYEKITWTVYNNSTSGSAIDLSLDSYNSWLCTWSTVPAGEVKTFTFDTTNTQAAALLGGTKEVAKPFAKVESGSGTVYFGTPMAWKTESVALPEGVEELSNKDLYDLASAVELDKCKDGVAAFTAALNLLAAEAYPEQAALLNAWTNLEMQVATDIGYLNINGDLSDNKVAGIRNTDLADLTDEQIALMGTYFEKHTGTDMMGNANIRDLSGYEKITWSFYNPGTVAIGSGGVGLNNYNDWLKTGVSYPAGFSTLEFTAENSTQAAKLLSGEAEATKPYVKKASGSLLYAGSPLAWKSQKATLPAGAHQMTAEELYAAACEVDLDRCAEGKEDFVLALAALEDYVISLDPLKIAAKKLADAWAAMSKVVTETVAIPGTYSSGFGVFDEIKEVTDTTVVEGLSDISLLGTHWVENETVDRTSYDTRSYWMVRVDGIDPTTVYDEVFFYSIGYDADGNAVAQKWTEQIGGGTQYPTNYSGGWRKFSGGTEISVGNVSKIVVDTYQTQIATFSIGSVLGTRTVVAEAPEDPLGMSLATLVELAKEYDTTGYDTTEFDAALAEAEALVEAIDPAETAREMLIAAWQQLATESKFKVDVIAVPKEYEVGSDSQIYNRKEVTADTEVEGLTDAAVLGTYYIDMLPRVSGSGYLDFQMALKTPVDMTKYLSVYFYAASYDADGAPTRNKINCQVNHANSVYTEFSNWKKIGAPTVSSAATSMKFTTQEFEYAYLSYGSVLGEYNYTPVLPENYKTMSLDALVQVAKEVDAEGFKNAEAFKAALAAAEQYVDISLELRQKLMEEWEALSKTYLHEVAFPRESYVGNDSNTYTRQPVTADTAVAGLLDASVLGTYYVDKIFMNEAGWNNEVNKFGFIGSEEYAKLSIYDKVYVWFAAYDADGNFTKAKTNVQVGSSNSRWTEGTGWMKATVANTGSSDGISLIVETAPNISYLSLGGVFGTYTTTAEIPENADDLCFIDLVKAAADCDVSEFDATAFKAVLEECRDLIVTRRQNVLTEWDKLNLSKPEGLENLDEEALAATARTQDFSAVTKSTSAFGQAVWMLDKLTENGEALEALRVAWKAIDKVPSGYRLLTPAAWVELGEALDISGAAEADQLAFTEALAAVKDLLTKGMADSSVLEDLLGKANSMLASDFTAASWPAFGAARAAANAVMDNYAKATQNAVDQAAEALLAVWGDLVVYSERTLWLNYMEYFTGQDPAASYNSEGTAGSFAPVNIDLPNGMKTGLTVEGQKGGWNPINVGGIRLDLLKGYDLMEIWFKANPDECKASRLTLQLMINGGVAWYNLYYDLPASAFTGEWVRLEIPLSAFGYRTNGSGTSEYTLDMDETPIARVRLMTTGGSANNYQISSFAAVKTSAVTAGEAPTAGRVVMTERKEDPIIPPENPFTGVDRGDPWGEKEKEENKKPDEDKDQTEDKEPEKLTQVATGSCGDQVTWTLNSDGELIILGVGAMDDYTDVAPWNEYLDQILTVTVKDGVTHVGDSAFYGCTSLQKVSLPQTLTSIGSYAFYECPLLTFMVVPDSVDTIGDYALGYVYVDGAAVPVEDYGIYGTAGSAANEYADIYGLNFYAIAPNPNDVADDDFGDSDDTDTDDENEGTETPEAEVVGSGTCGENLTWTYYSDGKLVISGTGDMDNFEDTTPWEAHLYDITAVVIEDGVTGVGDSAFYGCRNMTEVTLPASVTRIGSFAFYECYALTSVKLSSAVTSVGPYAFGYVYDEALQDVKILEGFKLLVTDPSAGLIYAQTYEVPYEVYSKEDTADGTDTPNQDTDVPSGTGLDWWIWLLIAGGGVVVLAGGACVILIVLKKKKNSVKTEVAE